jgi:hypothetical protein
MISIPPSGVGADTKRARLVRPSRPSETLVSCFDDSPACVSDELDRAGTAQREPEAEKHAS